jgi:hypothetical protein
LGLPLEGLNKLTLSAVLVTVETDNILNVFVAECVNICFGGNKPEDGTDPVAETKCVKFQFKK